MLIIWQLLLSISKYYETNIQQKVSKSVFIHIFNIYMTKVIKYNLAIIFILISLFISKAQFISAIVGIDGLTCSACSFSTEKSIRKLIFVDSVYMELEKNIATVYFKKNTSVSIHSLAQKVVDAGFAVRSIHAIYDFKDLKITPDQCWEYENNIYHFIKTDKEQTLSGPTTIKFIGEKYMQKAEYKKWKLLCTNTCNKLTTPLTKNVYHITLF